jgi:pyruvate dehydrogenase E2 component (dihydrolipoamide acetyltransferase)
MVGKETVRVPDIGGAEAADVVEVLVAVGDEVALEQGLIVLESDKASMEIPASVAGTIVELLAQEGAQLAEGDPIAVIETAAASADDAAPVTGPEPGDTPDLAPSPPPVAATPADSTVASPPPTPRASAEPAPAGAVHAPGDPQVPRSERSYAGPAVRKLAREFGLPLDAVRGSGPRGRILKEDLHQYAQRALAGRSPGRGAGLPEVPEVDFSRFGPVDVVERSRVDRLTADNMQRSWLNVPHVTQFDDADITDMEAFRNTLKAEAERRGVRLTPLPFLLKASAAALARHEKLNASLSDGGTTLTLKRYVHIGVAVDTPAGLVVPVIRDVQRKSLWELAAEVIDLANRARERKLKPDEMQGASFSVSSLGAIGGRGFTPIVNTPEVAILGVGRAATQPVWDGSQFQPRLLLPLALSYDHRVVNGGDAGRFPHRSRGDAWRPASPAALVPGWLQAFLDRGGATRRLCAHRGVVFRPPRGAYRRPGQGACAGLSPGRHQRQPGFGEEHAGGVSRGGAGAGARTARGVDVPGRLLPDTRRARAAGRCAAPVAAHARRSRYTRCGASHGDPGVPGATRRCAGTPAPAAF